VVVAGIAVVALFGLAGHGVEVIGRVEGAVPGLVLPAVGWSDVVALLPGALAIAVIGYAESATVAESLADEHGYTVRPDRELLAIGGANVLAGLFQGFITGGGASQSAANDRAGAQTQLVSLLVSGLTVLTAVALLPLFHDLPQAVLGAVVIAAVAGFLNVAALRRIARLRRTSFVLALLALAGVLVFGVLGGLLLAVVISIVLLLDRQSRPDSTVRTEPGLVVFRLDAPLLFLNAKLVRDRVRELLDAAPKPVRIVLVDLRFTPDVDVESVNALAALHQELARRGVALWLGNVRTGAQELLRRSGLAAAIGEDRLYRSLADAGPDSGPPSAPDRGQPDRWVRAKNSSALRVLGSWGPVALRPWPATNLTAPAYTSSTVWGVALVESSTSGTWPG
jgi:MFS superfamily sulfate permease-like transporter